MSSSPPRHRSASNATGGSSSSAQKYHREETNNNDDGSIQRQNSSVRVEQEHQNLSSQIAHHAGLNNISPIGRGSTTSTNNNNNNNFHNNSNILLQNSNENADALLQDAEVEEEESTSSKKSNLLKSFGEILQKCKDGAVQQFLSLAEGILKNNNNTTGANNNFASADDDAFSLEEKNEARIHNNNNPYPLFTNKLVSFYIDGHPSAKVLLSREALSFKLGSVAGGDHLDLVINFLDKLHEVLENAVTSCLNRLVQARSSTSSLFEQVRQLHKKNEVCARFHTVLFGDLERQSSASSSSKSLILASESECASKFLERWNRTTDSRPIPLTPSSELEVHALGGKKDFISEVVNIVPGVSGSGKTTCSLLQTWFHHNRTSKKNSSSSFAIVSHFLFKSVRQEDAIEAADVAEQKNVRDRQTIAALLCGLWMTLFDPSGTADTFRDYCRQENCIKILISFEQDRTEVSRHAIDTLLAAMFSSQRNKGKNSDLLFIIDEAGEYPNILRGLCSVRSKLSQSLATYFGFGHQIVFAAVGTGVEGFDGTRTPGSLPSSYERLIVKPKNLFLYFATCSRDQKSPITSGNSSQNNSGIDNLSKNDSSSSSSNNNNVINGKNEQQQEEKRRKELFRKIIEVLYPQGDTNKQPVATNLATYRFIALVLTNARCSAIAFRFLIEFCDVNTDICDNNNNLPPQLRLLQLQWATCVEHDNEELTNSFSVARVLQLLHFQICEVFCSLNGIAEDAPDAETRVKRVGRALYFSLNRYKFLKEEADFIDSGHKHGLLVDSAHWVRQDLLAPTRETKVPDVPPRKVGKIEYVLCFPKHQPRFTVLESSAMLFIIYSDISIKESVVSRHESVVEPWQCFELLVADFHSLRLAIPPSSSILRRHQKLLAKKPETNNRDKRLNFRRSAVRVWADPHVLFCCDPRCISAVRRFHLHFELCNSTIGIEAVQRWFSDRQEELKRGEIAVLINAPRAPFADVIVLTPRKIFLTQCKHYTSSNLTREVATAEFNKLHQTHRATVEYLRAICDVEVDSNVSTLSTIYPQCLEDDDQPSDEEENDSSKKKQKENEKVSKKKQGEEMEDEEEEEEEEEEEDDDTKNIQSKQTSRNHIPVICSIVVRDRHFSRFPAKTVKKATLEEDRYASKPPQNVHEFFVSEQQAPHSRSGFEPLSANSFFTQGPVAANLATELGVLNGVFGKVEENKEV